MQRHDLLSLTPDDLAALTNRGTVKRALRELEEGEVQFTIRSDDAGEVHVSWTDDSNCIFPAGKTASDARCNCIATTICRHIVRSVLAYQKQYAPASGSDLVNVPASQPWDPGQITDATLEKHFKKSALAAARTRFAQGVLVDLVRSSKPTARFHQLACSLRFIVPGDARYTHCDCAEPAPCGHVPLAVWAFRELAADQPAGFVSTQSQDLPIPTDLLDSGEALLRELAESGVAGSSSTWKDRVLRLAAPYEVAELIWPWEILAELVQEQERYLTHDARFSPENVARLVGEWLIRADAIRSGTRSTPQMLIRGSSSDRATQIGSARYVGVGCGVEVVRGGVVITAYMQDTDSGSLVAASREFADPAKESEEAPKEFSRLADLSVVRGISLAALGSGQLLLQGGKRAPDHRLIIGRAKASSNPQTYAWESLRAPLLVGEYGELRARLNAMPPSSLRPRYVAENLHVLPVVGVAGSRFDEATQTIEIRIIDGNGESAIVRHPYLARASEGCESLLDALDDTGRRLCFVAGQVRQAADGLEVSPVSLVFERDGLRSVVHPWVGRSASDPRRTKSKDSCSIAAHPVSLANPFISDLLTRLGEQFLVGLRRADASAAKGWSTLAGHGQASGFARLSVPIAQVAEELTRKLSSTRWQGTVASRHLLHAAMMCRLAQDLM